MTGGFTFKLVSKKVQYEFTVRRKIMRITGDSAAGKSELARTLLDAQNPRAGITVTCRYPCAVLDDQAFRAASREILKLSGRIKNHDSAEFYHAARRLLADYDNCLFFVDEDFSLLGSREFALFCKHTDSFFVLICRDCLGRLPYSYTDIYTMKTSGKFHTLVPKYNASDYMVLDEKRTFITEDSNAGFQFFDCFYNGVISARGKSKIRSLLTGICCKAEIIADGAAFGSEIDALQGELLRRHLDVILFLPESFEWLLLSSGLFSNDIVPDEALHPVSSVSGLYFSWEQYFTDFLMKITKNCENSYSKKRLNTCCYLPCCCKKNPNCNLIPAAKKKQAVLGMYLKKGNTKLP